VGTYQKSEGDEEAVRGLSLSSITAFPLTSSIKHPTNRVPVSRHTPVKSAEIQKTGAARSVYFTLFINHELYTKSDWTYKPWRSCYKCFPNKKDQRMSRHFFLGTIRTSDDPLAQEWRQAVPNKKLSLPWSESSAPSMPLKLALFWGRNWTGLAQQKKGQTVADCVPHRMGECHGWLWSFH